MLEYNKKHTGIDLKIEISENDGLRSVGIDEVDIAEFKLSTEMWLNKETIEENGWRKRSVVN